MSVVPTTIREQKPAAVRAGSKQAQLIALLMRPNGKSIDELSQAFGWLPHTTRAVISGLRKSGHIVTRAKSDGGQSLYRIEAPAEATASDTDA
jgi:predicted ArsR family transcriptional regulator